jgi:hypothetical protein
MRAAFTVLHVALAILAVGVPRALADARWTPIAQTEDSVYLLDESSIEFRSGVLTAWELVEYAWPQFANGVRYQSQMNLRAYRCDDGLWDVLRVSRHADSGPTSEVVLASTFDASRMDWYPAAPESVAGVMLNRVCTLAAAKASGAATSS